MRGQGNGEGVRKVGREVKREGGMRGILKKRKKVGEVVGEILIKTRKERNAREGEEKECVRRRGKRT